MQDNLIMTLYNSLGVSRDQREAVARSTSEELEMRVDLPILDRRRITHTLPAPMTKLPGMHMTLYAVPPQGVEFDPATLVFSNNSVFCPLDDLLGPWSETLGTIMRAYPIHDPDSSPTFTTRESSENTYVHMAASHSELEPRNLTAKAPSNLAPLKLAYQLFIAPSLFSHPTTEENGHRLVTPVHVSNLPSSPEREELWREFESMTVLHNGLLGPELKRRVDLMFAWAEGDLRSGYNSMDMMSEKEIAPPTLAFFSVVCAAFSIGAQSKECKISHRQANERAAHAAAEAGDSLHPGSMGSPTSGTSSSSPSGSVAGGSKSNSPEHAQPSRAQELHNLAIATRLAHDQMDLPPSLDYILAHMLSWLYLLHPANVVSLISDTPGTINGGGPFSPDARVWKELGKIVNVARTMGLGIDPDTPMMGDEVHAAGVWEKEMRRRVWWELCWFDAYMSECMGHVPLIDQEAYNTQLPSDVNESQFRPDSTEMPLPNGSTTTTNISHFVYKCRLVKLSKELERYPVDQAELESSIAKARAYEAEIAQWKASLPSHLYIQGLPDTIDNSWNETRQVVYPASDIMGMQACHLYTMANALIVRLWTPFLFPTLKNAQFHQYPALACTTAANAIVTACNYVRKQFRAIRPANLGYYALGRSVYIAGCMASIVAIRGGPELHFCETAVRTVKTAIEISKDPAVCGVGRPDPRTYRFETGRVLELMRLKAENTLKQGIAATGTKRINEGPQQEILKLRAGYELPYAGRGIVTTSCTLRLNYEPVKKSAPAYGESEGEMTSDEEGRRRGVSSISYRPPPANSFRAPSPAAPPPPRQIRPAPSSESENDVKNAKAFLRPNKRRPDASPRHQPSNVLIGGDGPSSSAGQQLMRGKSRSAEILSGHSKPARKKSSADVFPPPAHSSRVASGERSVQQPPPIITSVTSPWKEQRPTMDTAGPSSAGPPHGPVTGYSSSDTDGPGGSFMGTRTVPPLTPSFFPGPGTASGPGSTSNGPMSPHAMSPGYENPFMPSMQQQMTATHSRAQSYNSASSGPDTKFMQVNQHAPMGGDNGFDGGVSHGSWGGFVEPSIADLGETVSYPQQIQSPPGGGMMGQPPSAYQFDPSHVPIGPGSGGQPQYAKANPPVQQHPHNFGGNPGQYTQQGQQPHSWQGEYNSGPGMNMGAPDYNTMSQSYVQGGQPPQHWQNPGGGR
ncbi:hypothetical protein FRB90_009558 [Tulasnella sp. 427]|nr:hypothetical protein FRB90_009558 [Tulasnella sp. 427]